MVGATWPGSRANETSGSEGLLGERRESVHTIAPFRSGLYYLAKRKPKVELVPAYLENLNRILPKGEVLPVPLISLLTFGVPIHVGETEDKHEFLERASAAMCALRRKGES